MNKNTNKDQSEKESETRENLRKIVEEIAKRGRKARQTATINTQRTSKP